MLSDNKRSLRQIDGSRGRDVLELAKNHAERQYTGAYQEECGLECRSWGFEEVAAEDFAPAVNEHACDGKGDAHDRSKPKQRCGRVAHPDVLPPEQELRQAPAKTAEGARGSGKEEAAKHKVSLSRDHEKNTSADEEYDAYEPPGELFKSEEEGE